MGGIADSAETPPGNAECAPPTKASDDDTNNNKDRAHALLEKALAFWALEQYQEAIDVYDELVRCFGADADPAVREQVAMAVFNKGGTLGDQLARYDDAIAVYDEVLDRYGQDPAPGVQAPVLAAFVNKGNTLAGLGRTAAAMAVRDELIRRFIASADPAVRSCVAATLLQQGDALAEGEQLEDAIGVYDQIAGRYGDAPEPGVRALAAQALCTKGVLLGRLGLGEASREVLADVVASFRDTHDPALRRTAARAQAALERLRAGKDVTALAPHGRPSRLRELASVTRLRGLRRRPGADFAGASMPGAALSGANLIGVVLDDSHLEGANLAGADLTEAKLRRANLRGCTFEGANLWKADLTDADLRGADLHKADLRLSNLERADLREARLLKADLAFASLVDADLRGAGLVRANLDDACLDGADLSDALIDEANLSRTSIVQARLTGARVYGCATWDVTGTPKDQTDLIVTPAGTTPVHVDNIEVAQLVYLLLHNAKLRDVIDTVTSKGVLILGRFGEHKPILDALRAGLRDRGYVPIMLDSDPAESRDVTETVRTLAGLSRFVVADLTDPRSVPHELQSFVPFIAVPVITIIREGQEPYALFRDFRKYEWVLDEPMIYRDAGQITRLLQDNLIERAETLADRVAALRR